jgi:hypothetical protein
MPEAANAPARALPGLGERAARRIWGSGAGVVRTVRWRCARQSGRLQQLASAVRRQPAATAPRAAGPTAPRPAHRVARARVGEKAMTAPPMNMAAAVREATGRDAEIASRSAGGRVARKRGARAVSRVTLRAVWGVPLPRAGARVSPPVLSPRCGTRGRERAARPPKKPPPDHAAHASTPRGRRLRGAPARPHLKSFPYFSAASALLRCTMRLLTSSMMKGPIQEEVTGFQVGRRPLGWSLPRLRAQGFCFGGGASGGHRRVGEVPVPSAPGRFTSSCLRRPQPSSPARRPSSRLSCRPRLPCSGRRPPTPCGPPLTPPLAAPGSTCHSWPPARLPGPPTPSSEGVGLRGTGWAGSAPGRGFVWFPAARAGARRAVVRAKAAARVRNGLRTAGVQGPRPGPGARSAAVPPARAPAEKGRREAPRLAGPLPPGLAAGPSPPRARPHVEAAGDGAARHAAARVLNEAVHLGGAPVTARQGVRRGTGRGGEGRGGGASEGARARGNAGDEGARGTGAGPGGATRAGSTRHAGFCVCVRNRYFSAPRGDAANAGRGRGPARLRHPPAPVAGGPNP